MDSLSVANGSFAIDLFKKLNENDSKCNLFFSPWSISSALAMIYLGAKGNTASQMSKVLQFEKAKNVHSSFQSLISEINKPGSDYLLRTANRLYGEKAFTFLDEFLGSTQKHYHADLQAVDFSGKSEECRKEINTWVEEKTEGKIQDLLPSGSVDSLTRLVLVNAIYFKGNWANQFDKQRTSEKPFKLNKNETKPVQMMFKKAKFPMTYVGDLLTKVIELPYVNNELSMFILLPDEIQDGTTGLEKLEQELTYEKFADIINPSNLEKTEVELFLPKFKLENFFDLGSVLGSLGMTDAFDIGRCDLSGMSGDRDLVLSKVLHKSFVEVNEEGTEAAAATGAVIMLRCARFVPRFVCDHPFLFFIVHKQSCSVLFFGRFASPAAATTPPSSVKSTAERIAEGNTEGTKMDALTFACTSFSLDLFRKLSESNRTGNIFYSPLSISSAMGMISIGTKGKTAEQVSKVLHFDAVKDVHSEFKTLNAQINKKESSSYTLNLANRLFGEKTFNFSSGFLSSLQSLYQAKLGTVDFLTASEAARKEINTWVSEQTKGKIPEVLSAGSVNATTRLVLVNALYFKGDWAEKFNVQQTTDAPFKLSKNEQKTVKIMYQKKKFPFNYVPEINCRILELPYVKKELSMIIILPDSIDDDTTGLQKVEMELTVEKFQEWTHPDHMHPIYVHVHLPKFKLEDSYMLKPVLSDLGMVDIFDAGRADLSGMSGSKNLFLSEVVHKTFVEVNEEGSEAAAATAGIAMVMSMPIEENFKADHPFLFFIRDNRTGITLFAGRYSSP
ncbi:uncharacterized protein ACMZJ9_009517 [Mantella aurantiaca]